MRDLPGRVRRAVLRAVCWLSCVQFVAKLRVVCGEFACHLRNNYQQFLAKICNYGSTASAKLFKLL